MQYTFSNILPTEVICIYSLFENSIWLFNFTLGCFFRWYHFRFFSFSLLCFHFLVYWFSLTLYMMTNINIDDWLVMRKIQIQNDCLKSFNSNGIWYPAIQSFREPLFTNRSDLKLIAGMVALSVTYVTYAQCQLSCYVYIYFCLYLFLWIFAKYVPLWMRMLFDWFMLYVFRQIKLFCSLFKKGFV